MMSIIYGVLALISLALSVMCFFIFSGSPIVYCGLLLLCCAAILACGFFESLPNYDEIEQRVTDFFTEEGADYE